MLIKSDKTYLQKTFVTKTGLKHELNGLEKRMDEKFVTKHEIGELKKHIDEKFATKNEIGALKKHIDEKFVTKDGVRDVVREELNAVESDWIRKITDSVTKALGEKIDKMYVKLDTFIGEIKARRAEQDLHQGQHDKIAQRLDRLDSHTGLSPL